MMTAMDKELMKAMLRAGAQYPLLPGLHRNYPIFQKEWTGEDYSIVWPPSDRLNALRSGAKVLPASVREWLERGAHA